MERLEPELIFLILPFESIYSRLTTTLHVVVLLACLIYQFLLSRLIWGCTRNKIHDFHSTLLSLILTITDWFYCSWEQNKVQKIIFFLRAVLFGYTLWPLQFHYHLLFGITLLIRIQHASRLATRTSTLGRRMGIFGFTQYLKVIPHNYRFVHDECYNNPITF